MLQHVQQNMRIQWHRKDLAHANRLDPSNQTVERLLARLSLLVDVRKRHRLRAERRVQREKDSKTFTGMFDRGQIYDKASRHRFLPL